MRKRLVSPKHIERKRAKFHGKQQLMHIGHLFSVPDAQRGDAQTNVASAILR